MAQEHNDLNLPLIPKQFRYTEEARKKRLSFVEEHHRCALPNVNKCTIPSDLIKGLNGNNIGSVEVPVGIAGPLLFTGNLVKGVIYAPLGTCEGALVESVTRGALAISKSGGVYARALEQRMMRVPIFEFSSIRDAVSFCSWIKINEPAIFGAAQTATTHGRIKSVIPRVVGRHVHLEFLFTTGDAAGQNISTICTSVACQWIKHQLIKDNINLVSFSLEGNMSSDKKVSYTSFIKGRGIRVVAEVFLQKDILKSVLDVTPDALFAGYLKGVSGSIEAGMIGCNVNIANVITAIFVATGQDIACAHESSIGNLYLEKTADGVYTSLTIPSLIVGSIGGGTKLPAQNELLRMLDCYGENRVFRLAEIIAGFCLALDISTLTAMVSNVFASAHERLARTPTKAYLLKESSPVISGKPDL